MDISQLVTHCHRIMAAAVLTTLSLSVQAAPLNLTLLAPDITASFINTDYDASSDVFITTYGLTTTLNDGINPPTSINGSFSLTASISAGGVFNSGSLSATDGVNTLITGTIFDFGFSDTGGQTLEFLFTPTGGTLMADYLATSTKGWGGVIMSNTGYNGDDFNSSFSTASYNGVADIAPVPVPAAVWLFATGLIALTGIARRKA